MPPWGIRILLSQRQKEPCRLPVNHHLSLKEFQRGTLPVRVVTENSLLGPSAGKGKLLITEHPLFSRPHGGLPSVPLKALSSECHCFLVCPVSEPLTHVAFPPVHVRYVGWFPRVRPFHADVKLDQRKEPWGAGKLPPPARGTEGEGPPLRCCAGQDGWAREEARTDGARRSSPNPAPTQNRGPWAAGWLTADRSPCLRADGYFQKPYSPIPYFLTVIIILISY